MEIKNKNITVILDNGHALETPGKRSPDGKFREYKFAREVVAGIVEKLTELDIVSIILTPEIEKDVSLSERVRRANKIYSESGKKAILISVHVNAAGNGSAWMNGQGWQVCVAQNASSNSKRLANCLFDAANSENLKMRKPTANQKYWIQSLAICRDTNCPAVLTENLFMDNKQDLEYLMSEEGKETIINLHVNGIINYLNDK